MELWSLLIRTMVIYFVVFLIMRFMGKREIGKLSLLDLVISFMIAEIAVFVIEDTNRPMWEGIVPMLVLLFIQVVTAYISIKSRNLRLLFDGKPSVVIAKGKINREEMRKQRYNLDDMMLQLRENQITSVADVEFAILETNGKLSIIPKDASKDSNTAATAAQVKEKVIPPGFRFEILPIPLIMDGKVQDGNLKKIEKTRFWLKNVLQEQNVHDFKDVLLCTIDHKGKLFVDAMSKKIT